MHEFLTYFLTHMPSNDEWVAFVAVNIVAYVAAKNTVLRQERQIEKKAYAQRLERLEAERSVYIRSHQEQWTMIQKQAKQIQELNLQLNAVKQLHLN